MQSLNPYEELIIESSNYSKIIPNSQAESDQYEIPQQPIIVPPISLIPPQIEVISITDDSNLLQHKNVQEKKTFIIKVGVIGLIQEIMMLLSVNNSPKNSELVRLCSDKNIVRWPYYFLILVSIISIMLNRFLKPTKNYFLQGVILACMTTLYIIQASAINFFIFTFYYPIFWLSFLWQQVMPPNIGQTRLLQLQANDINVEFIAVEAVIVSITIIRILIFTKTLNSLDQFLLSIVSITVGFMVFGWSIFFGAIFLLSIEQLINGKCNLQIADFAAAATIVYGNMITLFVD